MPESEKKNIEKKTFIDVFFFYLLAYVLLILTLVITWQVISRTLNIHNTWTEELARYVFVWSSFLGAAYFIYKNNHIIVDLIKETPILYKISKIFKLPLMILTMIFYALITYGGILYVMKQGGEISGGMHIPMRIVYLSCPVSFFLMTLFQFFNIVKYIINRREGK